MVTRYEVDRFAGGRMGVDLRRETDLDIIGYQSQVWQREKNN